jgi:hypothetical protein
MSLFNFAVVWVCLLALCNDPQSASAKLFCLALAVPAYVVAVTVDRRFDQALRRAGLLRN